MSSECFWRKASIIARAGRRRRSGRQFLRPSDTDVRISHRGREIDLMSSLPADVVWMSTIAPDGVAVAIAWIARASPAPISGDHAGCGLERCRQLSQ